MRARDVRVVVLLSLVTTVLAAQSLPLAAQTAVPAAEQSTSPPRPPRKTAAPVATNAQPLVAPKSSSASSQTLEVQDAWVRATPGVDMAVAYLTLRNNAATAVTVTGVESPIAGHAMIHETKVEGGQSKMRPHEQLVVAPGSTIKLAPGGLHVMLHDLKQPLTVGQKVPLVILLTGGATIQVSALVRPLDAE